jgi:hypothetical protein
MTVAPMPTAADLREGDVFRQPGRSGRSAWPPLMVLAPPEEWDAFSAPGELRVRTQMVDGFGRPIEFGRRAVYFAPKDPVWIIYRGPASDPGL